MLKPLIPVVEDSLEHCFAEAYHVATVHAKYGNNHLEKEMASTNDDNNNKNILKDEDAVPAHITIAGENFCFKIIQPEEVFYSSFNCALITTVLDKHIPPPKFC